MLEEASGIHGSPNTAIREVTIDLNCNKELVHLEWTKQIILLK